MADMDDFSEPIPTIGKIKKNNSFTHPSFADANEEQESYNHDVDSMQQLRQSKRELSIITNDSNKSSPDTVSGHLEVLKPFPNDVKRETPSTESLNDHTLVQNSPRDRKLETSKIFSLNTAIRNCSEILQKLDDIVEFAIVEKLWTIQDWTSYKKKALVASVRPHTNHEDALFGLTKIIFVNMHYLNKILIPESPEKINGIQSHENSTALLHVDEDDLSESSRKDQSQDVTSCTAHIRAQIVKIYKDTETNLVKTNRLIVCLAGRLLSHEIYCRFTNDSKLRECKPEMKEWEILGDLSGAVLHNISLLLKLAPKPIAVKPHCFIS